MAEGLRHEHVNYKVDMLDSDAGISAFCRKEDDANEAGLQTDNRENAISTGRYVGLAVVKV